MLPKPLVSSPQSAANAWEAAQSDLQLAHQRLSSVAGGRLRQLAYEALLDSERQCSELAHAWLAHALGLELVRSPTHIISLDVDGVLEDESEGYSSTGLSGVAALKLMQLGRVAVLLNTARSLVAVKDRVRQFKLLGGVGSFGAATWDGVFGRQRSLRSELGAAELDTLRGYFQADDTFVVDTRNNQSLCVSRIIDGVQKPIIGADARSLLDNLSLTAIRYWVAPRYTYFVDSSVDKATGINHLREDLGVNPLPLAAMGDSECDVPMLRLARLAFVPAATLSSYIPSRSQRLFRSRHLGQQALWEAACRLVPDNVIQRQVLLLVSSLEMPTWLPPTFVTGPIGGGRLGPRLTTMFSAGRRTDGPAMRGRR